VEHAAGRIAVIAGTGANSTSEAIELTAKAKTLGVDACLLVAPYYNKPTQEGLYQHFAAVANAVDIAQILYNVPSRTGCDIANDTALRLAAIKNIVGIKDATGGVERGTDLLLRAPKDFAIYSGDHGVISVTANVVPKLMKQMCVAAMAGNVKTACEINAKLFALHQKLFIEPNPIPVKWVLQQMGLIKAGIRLPMLNLSAQFHDGLRAAMKNAEIV
jgi:4-hydroxy-tetrahydrodipicolinate synthase